MTAGRLIEILSKYDPKEHVFMSFDGFEQDYWIDGVSVRRFGGLALVGMDKLEAVDIIGAARLAEPLTKEQEAMITETFDMLDPEGTLEREPARVFGSGDVRHV